MDVSLVRSWLSKLARAAAPLRAEDARVCVRSNYSILLREAFLFPISLLTAFSSPPRSLASPLPLTDADRRQSCGKERSGGQSDVRADEETLLNSFKGQLISIEHKAFGASVSRVYGWSHLSAAASHRTDSNKVRLSEHDAHIEAAKQSWMVAHRPTGKKKKERAAWRRRSSRGSRNKRMITAHSHYWLLALATLATSK